MTNRTILYKEAAVLPLLFLVECAGRPGTVLPILGSDFAQAWPFVLLVVVLIAIARLRVGRSVQSKDTPAEILKLRYA